MPKIRLPEQSLAQLSQSNASSTSNDSNSNSSSSSEPTISVEIKGLRAPYKFSSTLTNISVATTVYTLKSLLITSFKNKTSNSTTSNTDTSGDEFKYLKPANIKLLKKGKLVTDSASLKESLGSDSETSLSLVAMITQPTAQEISVAKEEEAKQQELERQQKEKQQSSISAASSNKNSKSVYDVELSNKTWSSILSLLETETGSEQSAAEVLARLKEGWKMTASKASSSSNSSAAADNDKMDLDDNNDLARDLD